MSSAKTFPGEDCEQCNQSSSTMLSDSIGGATLIPFALNTPFSTLPSNATAMTSGEMQPIPSMVKPNTLSQFVFAPDYSARITDLIGRVAQATERPAMLPLLRKGANALGAENAMFVSFVRDDADMSACRFMLACDPDWCRQYLEAGLIAHDPWLAYATLHSEPILASSLNASDSVQQQVIDLAARNGFASAVLFPVHSGPGYSRVSLLCMGSSVPGFFEDEGFRRFRIGARMLALEFHDWWLTQIRRELIDKVNLTTSDLVLLRHQHRGHSSKRIAAELRVSQSSINSRFQRMNIKLGVTNRRMAARLACEVGLILE